MWGDGKDRLLITSVKAVYQLQPTSSGAATEQLVLLTSPLPCRF